MELLYTAGGVPRGSRADAKADGVWYLFKNVVHLRLTYQVRLLAFAAAEEGARLVIRVPRGCTPSRDLTAFIVSQGGLVRMEPVSWVGLYLCVFARAASDEELDGVEVGSYDDFGAFRDLVAERLESGDPGSRFPVLQGHHDSNGTWTAAEAHGLEAELLTVADELIGFEPTSFPSAWQREVAAERAIAPASLLDCFVDVDGQPLVQRLIDLARTAQESGQEIWFQ